MVSSFNSYCKVHNIGHPEVSEIFEGEVYIEEKIDGSQVSAHVDPDTGALRMRSRGREFPPDAPDGLFVGAAATFTSVAKRMVRGWTYRGESVQNKRHNHLEYDRVPFGNVVLFDVVRGDAEDYVSRDAAEYASGNLGLEFVPLLRPLGRVDIKSRGQLDEFLDDLLTATPLLGGKMIEGVVVKAPGRFGRDGKPLMGKYVSPRFREEQKVSWKANNPKGGDMIASLLEMLRSESRWEKGIQHLREDGSLEESTRDIGALVKEVQRDVEEECSDLVAQNLLRWAMPQIKRGVTRGLAEWYKDKLLNNQFGENDEDV